MGEEVEGKGVDKESGLGVQLWTQKVQSRVESIFRQLKVTQNATPVLTDDLIPVAGERGLPLVPSPHALRGRGGYIKSIQEVPFQPA